MLRSILGLAVSFVLSSLSPLDAAEPPGELLKRIRGSTLDVPRAVAIENVNVDLGVARLEVVSGILVPSTAVVEHPPEMVFVGQGRFHLQAPDPVEARQVEIFTGAPELHENVTAAVLVVPKDAVAARLLERAAILPGSREEQLRQARATFEAWRRGSERRSFGVEAILLRDAVLDPVVEEFAAVWCRSPRFDFFFTLDPEVTESIRVGRFVPLELGDHEQDQTQAQLRRERRKGRLVTMRVEDLGDWDTWVSASPRGIGGQPSPGSPGFEPTKYTLSAVIDDDLEQLRATARIDFQVQRPGLRVLGLDLHPDLAVRRVRDASGRELFFHRDGERLTLFLADAEGAAHGSSVEIEYSGAALFKDRWSATRLRSTTEWYPRGRGVDRAVYEVRLEWPKRVDLVGSGSVVGSGEEKGHRWERRRLDVPALGFSFEVGDYHYLREQVGHVAVTLAFLKTESSPGGDVREEVRAGVAEALRFYEAAFGSYPLDYVTVASVPPRGFSQGLLGFLTLDSQVLSLPRGWYLVGWGTSLTEDQRDLRRRVVAHELAHQWWGNLVGWAGERDVWLSEAVAEYSALLFDSSREGKKAVSLARWAEGRKEALAQPARNGLSVESLGPIAIGPRLFSSLSDDAYDAVVYEKGTLVFSMLARTIGEKAFTEMLRVLAERLANRSLDTDTFLRAIAKMSGTELGSFAAKFVHGTGLPELFYTYEIAPGEAGGWKVRGKVREVGGWSATYRLRQEEAGGWRLTRDFRSEPPLASFPWAVPFQMTVEGGGSPELLSPAGGRTTQQGLGGIVRFQGPEGSFEIAVERKPTGFWLDQRGELPAAFHSETRLPKDTLRKLGEQLTGRGDGSEAEEVFRKALAARLWPGEPPPGSLVSKSEEKVMTALEDVRIHLLLADLFLDRGRDGQARSELEIAEALLRGPESNRHADWRSEVRSRLDLHAGKMDEVYQALSKVLYLDFRQRADESAADQLRRKRFAQGRHGEPDAYAMLAVSAHGTGHEPVCALARKKAALLGVDVKALDALHPDVATSTVP